MRGVSLEYVWKKVTGQGRRGTTASLNLVSFIDFLVVTVIFLLMSFSASGEVPVDRSVTLAHAENVEDILAAPMVAVNRSQILLDGSLAGSTRAIEETGRIQRIDELFEMLKRKRELWTAVEPGREFPGVCTLQIDQDVPAVVVKSIFQTAVLAGYKNISFMVQKGHWQSL
jgi:biopolymer transport protein ExbD